MRKRIFAIILGAAAVGLSLLWMKNLDSNSNLIPAAVFSLGLVAALGSIKRILLELANRNASRPSPKR